MCTRLHVPCTGSAIQAIVGILPQRMLLHLWQVAHRCSGRMLLHHWRMLLHHWRMPRVHHWRMPRVHHWSLLPRVHHCRCLHRSPVQGTLHPSLRRTWGVCSKFHHHAGSTKSLRNSPSNCLCNLGISNRFLRVQHTPSTGADVVQEACLLLEPKSKELTDAYTDLTYMQMEITDLTCMLDGDH